MQKWILALPTKAEAQRTRQADLQKELTRLIAELSQRPGLGVNGVSFSSVPRDVLLYVQVNAWDESLDRSSYLEGETDIHSN